MNEVPICVTNFSFYMGSFYENPKTLDPKDTKKLQNNVMGISEPD